MKYDNGVERGAVLRIEGVCLPKVGRTPRTKTAVTNAGGKKKIIRAKPVGRQMTENANKRTLPVRRQNRLFTDYLSLPHIIP